MPPNTPPNVAPSNNFLVPNGTFFAELLAFLIILAVLWKFVISPIQKVMAERAKLIEDEAREASSARERMRAEEADYQQALQEARAEAARIRDAARERGQAIIDDACREAQVEADRVIAEGRARLTAERDALVDELRASIGSLAVDLAGRIVGAPIGDESEWRTTVDPFLGGITMVDGRLRSGEVTWSAELRPVTTGGVG